jgi:GNAT superfamily N-acetyltransferase
VDCIQVVMVRANLTDIPQYVLPPGYSFRFYRPGDADTWVGIWQDADSILKLHNVDLKTFHETFSNDLRRLEKRCLFVVSPDGREVGMATAWYDRIYAGKPWGRVHWVALRAGSQGKGLAKPLMTATLNLLGRLGHRRAVLGTQTLRLAAIKVYLDFGFMPDLSAADADRAWLDVQGKLHHPALPGA